MKQKVGVNNSGIDSSGLPRDYKTAIPEYIWNGFDAAASKIEIRFETNNIGTINRLQIVDNGAGIDFATLDKTFGNFNDSVKKLTYQKSSSSIKGNKGRGRFSFDAFSGQADWHTTYRDATSGKMLEYTITIRKNAKDYYDPKDKKISTRANTGTIVTFSDLFGVTGFSFEDEEFTNTLAREFGWFLLLNKDKGFTIRINEKDLEYRHFIADSETKDLDLKDADGNVYKFRITFIRWSEKIGDRFYFYFLDSKQNERFKELTSFNNNAIDFNHSVYIESLYFNSFNPNDTETSGNFFENNKQSPIYKNLLTHLQGLIKNKQKEFVSGEAAEKLITSYESNGVIPRFKNNRYDQARRNDLVGVVKGLYCIEPKLFNGMNREQQKVSVGLINLLLDTDERECIIDLVGQIVNLTSDERQELSRILKNTTVSKIARTINLIESRFKIVELLKHLVFDLTKFTNERDHLQKAIEENYWLLGEQYHLVSKNEGFHVLLDRYIFVLEGNNKGKKQKIQSAEANRRPDVFVCRKHSVPDPVDSEHLMEENLIVELKRPTVIIGKEQVRQIEDYMDIIRNEPQFNSGKRTWKFFVISTNVDQHVSDLYVAQKEKGRKFLIKAVNNFEIYAMTWDDIFMLFELRHKFLIDNLDFDKNLLKAELLEKGIDLYNDHTPASILNEIRMLELKTIVG